MWRLKRSKIQVWQLRTLHLHLLSLLSLLHVPIAPIVPIALIIKELTVTINNAAPANY
jgi:hypothetical protein